MSGSEPLEFSLIGADGGFLEAPLAVREVFLAPSERADVLLDLRTRLGRRPCRAVEPAVRCDDVR